MAGISNWWEISASARGQADRAGLAAPADQKTVLRAGPPVPNRSHLAVQPGAGDQDPGVTQGEPRCLPAEVLAYPS